MTIKKAIISAAGLGTRFLPAAKAMPKEMLPILDKPTIQYIVEEAAKAGIEGIMITACHNPKNYNDIKVYGAVGEQLLTEASLKLSEYIDQITDTLNIKVNDLKTLKENNIVRPFENETTEAYKKAVCDLVGAFKTQKSFIKKNKVI